MAAELRLEEVELEACVDTVDEFLQRHDSRRSAAEASESLRKSTSLRTRASVRELADRAQWVGVIQLVSDLLEDSSRMIYAPWKHHDENAAMESEESQDDPDHHAEQERAWHPHECVEFVTARILAYLRMRQFTNAAKDFELLGDLQAPCYLYSTYPHLYSNTSKVRVKKTAFRSDSMVPFELLVMSAEVRLRKKDESAVYDLYLLDQELHILLNQMGCHSPRQDRNSAVPERSDHDEPKQDLMDLIFGSGNKPEVEPALGHARKYDNLSERAGTRPKADAGFCASRDESFNAPDNKLELEAEQDLLKREDIVNKRKLVLSSLVHHHLMYHHYQSAVDVAKRLVRVCMQAIDSSTSVPNSGDNVSHESLVSAWLALMRTLLYTGKLDCAETVLRIASRHASSSCVSSGRTRTTLDLHVHRGLLLAMRGDMEGASDEFEAVHLLLQGDEYDNQSNALAQVVTANNVAVCMVHMGLVGDAIERLEDTLRSCTEWALDEGLVFNLCTFYELRYPHSATEKKKVLVKLSGRLSRHGFNTKSIT